jgi:hypothetical protein
MFIDLGISLGWAKAGELWYSKSSCTDKVGMRLGLLYFGWPFLRGFSAPKLLDFIGSMCFILMKPKLLFAML